MCLHKALYGTIDTNIMGKTHPRRLQMLLDKSKPVIEITPAISIPSGSRVNSASELEIIFL